MDEIGNGKDSTNVKTVNLALQGGGAHGAFAWGVLDRLLEDGRIGIEGICATSAGTMNACALAYGLHLGGPEKARECLHDFWRALHEAGLRYNPIRKMPWESMLGWDMGTSISWFLFDGMTRVFSPYQLNPLDFNPLRDVLDETIDFDELQNCSCVKLFISATNVRTGRVRVFDAPHVSLDVALASACLPFLFKAVKIDGEHYWDGGYMGNPALFPLFYATKARDVMIVHINPIERPQLPTTAPEIMDRVNEISFNSPLIQEIRSIAFVKLLLEHDMLKPEHAETFKDMLVHSVRADAAMCGLSAASKFDSDWGFLTNLRDRGREVMSEWLEENYAAIGERDSVDLKKDFVHSVTQLFGNTNADAPLSAFDCAV